MTDHSYEQRVRSQIEQYATTVDMHDLPPIFHFWSENYIKPGLLDVFGQTSINHIYADSIAESASSLDRVIQILSIGSGDGEVEINVAKILLDRGLLGFKFNCTDISSILLDTCRARVAEEGLGEYFNVFELDLNRSQMSGEFDCIMANHSLHHIQELEVLFDFCKDMLTPDGVFITSDMIGRNGHMRWPESAAVLRSIWPLLTDRQRYHYQLKRYNAEFTDHDCSTEGFEGIRSQDILSNLLERFYPYKFFATGGFIDLLVDRGFGPGFDVDKENDLSLIKAVADLNEILLDSQMITPTIMVASFTKNYRGEFFFRDRRAINCLRPADVNSRWTRFYR